MTNSADKFINDLIDEISRFSNAPDNTLLIDSEQCQDMLESIFEVGYEANRRLTPLPNFQVKRGEPYYNSFRRQLWKLLYLYADRYTELGFRRLMQAIAYCEVVNET
jgi:hypothetical protein